MKSFLNKPIIILLSIFSLTSCNLNNKILIDDLTLSDAKNYARLYLNNVVKTNDMNGKYISLLAYYGKIANKYHVLTFEYGSINPVNGTYIEETYSETINNIEFSWYHHFDQARGRVFIKNNIYTLTEAYENNLISLNDLKDYHEFYRDYLTLDVNPSYLYRFNNSID